MEVKNILRMKHFFVSFGALGPDFTRPTKKKAETDNSEKIKTKKKNNISYFIQENEYK